MPQLTATERVLNTFTGDPLDRLPLFDIIHSTDFIEQVSGRKITPQNAEDVTCQAVRRTLDLVRHFCIPEILEPRTIRDEDGFVYRDEWWTREIVRRPLQSLDDAQELMKRDIERIYACIEAQRFCHQAKEQVNLFGERYEYPEEVNSHFERVTGKLGDTMMIAPETVPGLYTAQNRYGFEWLIYMLDQIWGRIETAGNCSSRGSSTTPSLPPTTRADRQSYGTRRCRPRPQGVGVVPWLRTRPVGAPQSERSVPSGPSRRSPS